MTSPSVAAGELLRKVGVEIDPDLLVLALTHRSFAFENGGLPTNERLEFLGDSVLGLVATEKLYFDHPDLPEGELAKMRAASVSQRSLAEVAREIDLGSYVLLGKGEASSGGADKDSILCDAFEAVLGAVFVAHGIEVARETVLRLVGPTLDRAAHSGKALDWKSSLQELCSERSLPQPVYTAVGTGPDHARTFTATVSVDGVPYGSGTGSAKKHAEQEAASKAYEAIAASAS